MARYSSTTITSVRGDQSSDAGPATEQRVGVEVRSQRVGELVGEVTHHDAREDLPTFGREPGVARAPLAPELLEQCLSGRCHPTSLAVLVDDGNHLVGAGVGLEGPGTDEPLVRRSTVQMS